MTRQFTAADFAARLGGYVSASNPNNARVPAPGKSPRSDSLSIIVDPDAPDGFRNNCFSDTPWAECRDYIKAAMGIESGDGRAPQPIAKIQSRAKKQTAQYIYRDKNGDPYHRITRFDYEGGGGKTFTQERWCDVDWVSGADNVDENRKALGHYPPIPYNLPAIIANPDEPIWLVEGEKNADDLIALGLIATTAKGGATSFPTDTAFSVWFDGATVYALPDNDEPGQKWLERVLQAAPHATPVRLPGLPPKGDVSDWLEFGGTVEQLKDIATGRAEPEPERFAVSPTAFTLTDPTKIPPRKWIYEWRLIRGFTSLTVSPGGIGKSSLALVDALSMVTGRALFEDSQINDPTPLSVWYWNGEDPQEETARRIAAAAIHYNIKPEEIEGRLYTDTGREQEIVFGAMNGSAIEINEELFDSMERAIIARKIDVLILDPFVSVHRLSENDNTAIDAVIKRLNKLADRTGCAVEIVHHTRKPPAGSTAPTDANDARGASAILGAVRSARSLNVMTEDIASEFEIPKEDRTGYFSIAENKANLSARSGDVKWRKLESVALGNQSGFRKTDNVGVVTHYKPKKREVEQTNDLSGIQGVILDILRHNDMTRHWGGRNIPPKGWLGKEVIERMGLIDVKPGTINHVIKNMLNDKLIVLRTAKDNRNEVACYTLPEGATITPIRPDVWDDDDSPF